MRLLPLLLAPRLPSHCKRVFDQPAKTACAVAIRAKTAGLIFSIFLLTTPILALLACTVEEAAERTDGTDRQPTATMEQPTEDATPDPREDSPTPEATRGGIVARATATPATSGECRLINDPPFGDHLSYGDMIEVLGQPSDFVANSRITYQVSNRSPLNHFYVEEMVLSHPGQFRWFNGLQMAPVDTFPRQISDSSVDMYPGEDIRRRARPGDPELGRRWQSLDQECELVLGIFLYADPARDILLDREIVRIPLTPANLSPTATPPVPTAAPTEAPIPTAAPPAPTATLSAPVPTNTLPVPTQAPPATPAPTTAPTPTPVPAPTSTPAMSPLERYAAKHAGGPGAIYVGDLSQLVGPAPDDIDGDVTLGALERHRWIYESDYYKELLEKASLTNPTPLSSSGTEIFIGHSCPDWALLSCLLLADYFTPNLSSRTNGQVRFQVTSFSELGLAGPDTLQFLRDGILSSATVHSGYVGGEIPAIEILNLPSIYSSSEQEFEAAQAIIGDIDDMIQADTGGVIMNHNWDAGGGWFLYCKRPITSMRDLEGRKVGYRDPSMADWLEGMGADGRLYDLGDTFYTPLERGILDCALAEAWEGLSHRLYEVINYLNGPLSGGFNFASNVINPDDWRRIPQDLQQIIIEEAAKSELEALRLAAVQNETVLQRNIDGGLTFVAFSEEIKRQSFTVAMERVIPGWVQRAGGPRSPIIADTFNNKVGPIVGLRVRSDGTVVRIN